MQIVKHACLLLVLLAGAVFLWSSFQPRVRFAEPATNVPAMRSINSMFGCYHDRIYLGNSRSDALIFGSSRTRHAADADLVMKAYDSVMGKKLDVFVFHTPWSNPEIVYFFFRDYLTNNPAPAVALFELTPVTPLPPPVQYVHPFFADLAPAYLYLDILNSWDLVRHKLFAVSNFLHLLERHIDLNLSRLMVADFKYTVPEGDNCAAGAATDQAVADDTARFDSFEQMLENELRKTLPEFAQDEVGTPDSLLKTYAGNDTMTNVTKHATQKFGNPLTWPNTGHFWRRGAPAERSLDYYRRIVALGKAHRVKIGFYFMPDLLLPVPPPAQVDELAGMLGAPVYVLPSWYIRVSYHHYRDPAHIAAEFKPVYSTWFASLIDRITKSR